MKYEVGPDRSFPGAWRVEAIDSAGEGQVYMTTFFGLKGEERAREYAAWKNGQELATLAPGRASAPQASAIACEG